MSEKQRPLGSRASESFQQQGPPGEREQGVGASRSKKARSKIESAVLPNAPAGPGINAPNTTEGSAEEPEKYSREEEDKVKPKVVKAIEENVEKHKSSATAYTYGADEDGADSEDKSEYGEEPSEPEPAWEVLEQGRNTHTKIIETSYGPRVLHAKSTWSDIYLAMGETSIEAENYPSAKNDVEVAIGSERKGPEDSRSLAEALYQPGGTQTYPGNTLEVNGSLGEAIKVLVRRKKILEKLSLSYGITLGVVDLDGLVKDIGNICSKQRDIPKNQSRKKVAILRERIDSTMGRDEIKEEEIRTGARLLKVRKPGNKHFSFKGQCKKPEAGTIFRATPASTSGTQSCAKGSQLWKEPGLKDGSYRVGGEW